MTRRILMALLALAALSAPLHAGAWDSFKKVFFGQEKESQEKINVLIVQDQTAVLLETRGKYRIYDPNTKSHVSSRAIGKRKVIQSLPGGLKWGEEFPGIYQIQVIPEAGSTLFVDGVEYPGTVLVYDVGGSLSVVNRVTLEEYLMRVIPRQYAETLPQETLAAVTITGRTEALSYIKQPKNAYWNVDGKQVGYVGEDAQKPSPEYAKVIHATKSMVLSATGAYEGGVTPFLAKWGPSASGKETGTILSRISLYDAEELAKKGKDAAEILSQAFPSAHIELIK